jgi:hypothetical protein
MKDKHPKLSSLKAEELQLIEQLREHPELMERFKSILEITTRTEGPLRRADEVEGLLIEELRRLGNTGMGSWAARAERSLTEQLKEKDSSAKVRKKKTDVVVCIRFGQRRGAGLAHGPEELPAFVA